MMERTTMGLALIAFSMSALAQQGQPQGTQDELRNRPQQQELGEADKQQEAPAHMQRENQAASSQHGMQDTQQNAGQNQRAQQNMQRDDGQARGKALEQLGKDHGDISTFVKALQSTGLADAVAKGEYTAFAPTNDAFQKMDKSVDEMLKPENQQQLVSLLRNHLVADRVDAQRAKQLDKAKTVGGETLTLAESNGKLTVNGATVEETDIRAGGLTVHTIDQVLEPGSGATQSVAGQQRDGTMGTGDRERGSQSQSVAGQTEEPQD